MYRECFAHQPSLCCIISIPQLHYFYITIIGDPESFLYAASIGNLDTVSKKIRQEIDIDSMNEEGKTALMLASMKGHTDIAKLLLTNGASVEKKDKNQWSPLMWAIYGGSIEMIKLLLRENNQAQVGLCNSMGYSALFIACEWNNIDAAKLLLKKGAPVDLLNNKGMSPLMDACLHARTEIIKLLLEYDADVNLKNKKGQSARSFARHDEIISLLPEGTVDINKILLINNLLLCICLFVHLPSACLSVSFCLSICLFIFMAL